MIRTYGVGLLSALTGAAISLLAVQALAQTGRQQQYKVIDYTNAASPADLERLLNLGAEQGWKLNSVGTGFLVLERR